MKAPDINVLPDSSKMERDQRVGVKDNGYLDKKGTPSGADAHLIGMPPGSDITNQKVADIRPMDLVTYKGGLDYPGDGWE